MNWLARLRAFFEGFDGRVEEAARLQVQEDLDRARRTDAEFRLGGIGERDQLFGRATRDGVIYRRR